MIILLFNGDSMIRAFLASQSKLLPHFFINNHDPFPLITTENLWSRTSSRYFDIIWWIWMIVLLWLCRATLVVRISHVVLGLRVLFAILTVIAFTIIIFLRVKILLWWRNNKRLLRLQLLFLRINFMWSVWDAPTQEVIVLFMNRFCEVPFQLAFARITCKTLFDWTWFWVFHISVASLLDLLLWFWSFVNFLHDDAWRFQTLLIKLFLPRARSLLHKHGMIGNLQAFFRPFVTFASLRNTFGFWWRNNLGCLSGDPLVDFLNISRSVPWNNTLFRTLKFS